jgi:hypothetical protein
MLDNLEITPTLFKGFWHLLGVAYHPSVSSNVSQIRYQICIILMSSDAFLTMLNTFGITSVLPDVVNISWHCPTSFNVFLMLATLGITLVLFDVPIVP